MTTAYASFANDRDLIDRLLEKYDLPDLDEILGKRVVVEVLDVIQNVNNVIVDTIGRVDFIKHTRDGHFHEDIRVTLSHGKATGDALAVDVLQTGKGLSYVGLPESDWYVRLYDASSQVYRPYAAKVRVLADE